MVRYLTEDDVAATLTMAQAIELLDAASRALVAGNAVNAPRQRVKAAGPMLQVLPAALAGRAGFKAYTIGPRGVRFLVSLYGSNGELLALIEANALGQIRTGAASGLATKVLARPQATTLGIIGTGFQARTQAEAVCAVRPIAQAFAYGRDFNRLKAFCDDVAAQCGIPVIAVRNAHDAIVESDVVCTMTSASRPVFEGRWLKDGTHVNAAGSNRLTAQEIDVETVRRAAIVTVDDVAQAKVESGDLRVASEAGAFHWLDAIRLADVVAGTVEGRREPGEITLFESLGIGLWDVAAASHVYDACLAAGRGRETGLPSWNDGLVTSR
ncbi:MAG: ornithine cyclodeaminase family protein [Candidatus Velthaea sp.]|jgi:ornithine cyclodeaminase/alanine dehydrogenase